jgi:RHS repeat-associated protein
MPNRSFSTTSYRYGFNGQEKDDETTVNGGDYDFGARIYDSRLGRWLAVDPVSAKYPYLSPYTFTGNSPILFVDPNGKEIILHFKDKDGNAQQIKYTADMAANTGNSFVDEAITTMNTLRTGSKSAANYIDQAIKTTHKIDISYGNKDGAAYDSQGNDKQGNETGTFDWNPFIGDKMSQPDPTTGEKTQSSGITLIHELKHFLDHAKLLDNVKNKAEGAEAELNFFLTSGGASDEQKYVDKYENGSAVIAETEVAKDFQMGTRPNYDEIPKKVNTDGGMSTTPTKDKTKKEKFNKEKKEGAGSLPVTK